MRFDFVVGKQVFRRAQQATSDGGAPRRVRTGLWVGQAIRSVITPGSQVRFPFPLVERSLRKVATHGLTRNAAPETGEPFRFYRECPQGVASCG